MALEGPALRYVRMDEAAEAAENEGPQARALRLAREIEDLLAEAPDAPPDSARSAHSLRMARAMAASLVDELEAAVRGPRPARKSGVA